MNTSSLIHETASEMKRSLFLILIVCFANNALAQEDVSWDIKTGNEVARQVEKSIGLTHHPAAEKVVKSIGDRLVGKLTDNPYTFSFQIADQEEPNAFALPGGHI